MKSIPHRRFTLLFVLLFAGLMMPFALSAAPALVNANQPDLPEVARGVPKGGALRVFDLDLDQFGVVDLELERFTVFAPNAEILIDGGASVSPPNNRYFRGLANGLPNAIVVLTVPEQGKIRGLITDEAGIWLLAGKSGQGAPGLANRKIGKQELNSLPPFECGTEALLKNVGELTVDVPGEASIDTAALSGNVTHTARVAVETDYEYYAIFGNTTTALDYMGDLFAYASTVYEREVNTNLVIGWSRLWTTGATSDPWNATSGTNSALFEFRDYWRDSMGGVDRSIAHMLSGKGLGGGIAYVGVLCNASYGYGVSASLGGNFNIDSPSVVWDILVVSHEIGHNFDSSHTQDYCGNGGVSDPVDLCYSSANNCGNSQGLPGVGSLSGGSTADKPGTIMSYCHQVSGGYSNISFTFGMNHLYGVAGYRVPAVMYDHVLNRASYYPSCLELVDPTSPNVAPTAGFTFSTTDLTADFTDASSDSDGSVVAWSWNFGGGGTAAVQNPSHTYASAGTYNVILTVTDNDNGSDTVSQSVTVTAPSLTPAAPANLTASVQRSGKGKKRVITGVVLNWADNSSNEDVFVIERCEETGKGRSKACIFSELATVGANSTSFSDTPGSGTYKYRVMARNADGDSAYSNTVKI